MITWIASYPKSGNTWARMLLTAYHYDSPSINLMNTTTSVGDVGEYFYQAVSPVAIPNPQQQILLRPAVLMHIIESPRFKPALVKTHSVNLRAGSIDLIPHELTKSAIVIVRDPRDVCVSLADHMGESIDDTLDRMADRFCCIGSPISTFLSTWSENVSTWLAEDRFLTMLIRYEDLLEDSTTSLKKMLMACNTEVDDDRVGRAVERCSLENVREQERQLGFGEASDKTGTFFKRGTAGGWKKILSQAQLARIEKDHGEVMAKLGYTEASKA